MMNQNVRLLTSALLLMIGCSDKENISPSGARRADVGVIGWLGSSAVLFRRLDRVGGVRRLADDVWTGQDCTVLR